MKIRWLRFWFACSKMALSYLFATFEVTVPLLVAGDPSDGGRAAAALREALALNSRLGADYFVADFDGCSPDFLLSPQNTGLV